LTGDVAVRLQGHTIKNKQAVMGINIGCEANGATHDMYNNIIEASGDAVKRLTISRHVPAT